MEPKDIIEGLLEEIKKQTEAKVQLNQSLFSWGTKWSDTNENTKKILTILETINERLAALERKIK